jgi:hypothetical protein
MGFMESRTISDLEHASVVKHHIVVGVTTPHLADLRYGRNCEKLQQAQSDIKMFIRLGEALAEELSVLSVAAAYYYS